MKNKIILVWFFRLLPKSIISRIFGRIAHIPFPGFILNFFIRLYSKLYNVDQDEIDFPDEGFKTFDRFFTREVKPGSHKIDPKRNSIVSPVDARIDGFGIINDLKGFCNFSRPPQGGPILGDLPGDNSKKNHADEGIDTV